MIDRWAIFWRCNRSVDGPCQKQISSSFARLSVVLCLYFISKKGKQDSWQEKNKGRLVLDPLHSSSWLQLSSLGPCVMQTTTLTVPAFKLELETLFWWGENSHFIFGKCTYLQVEWEWGDGEGQAEYSYLYFIFISSLFNRRFPINICIPPPLDNATNYFNEFPCSARGRAPWLYTSIIIIGQTSLAIFLHPMWEHAGWHMHHWFHLE